MKKFLIALLCLLLIGAMFSGCVATRNEDEEEAELQEILNSVDFDADSSYKGTLNIAMNEEPSEISIMNTFVEEFNKQYPNIKVKITNYASSGYFGSLSSLHAAALNSGNFSGLPDVFWTAQDTSIEQSELGMLMPISLFDEKDDSFTFDSLVNSMVEACTVGDRIYMMPRDYNQVTTYVNVELFENTTGLDIDDYLDHAMTVEEMEEIMKLFEGKTNEKGEPLYAFDIYWNWESILWPLVKSNGGELIEVTEDGAVSAALESQETFEAYRKVKEWAMKNYITPLGSASCAMFANGRAAFATHSRPVMSDLLGYGNIQTLQAIPFPQLGEEYWVGAGSSGYGMYRYAAHPTEAWLFLKSIVSQASQNAFCASGAGVPILKDMISDKNSSFMTYTGEHLALNFNNAAFIYKYDTNSCTPMDYKKHLPVSSLTSVMNYFQESIVNAVNYTTAQNYTDKERGIWRYLRSCDANVNNQIAQGSK